MPRRERIIPRLLDQKFIVLVKERAVTLNDILDDQIAYRNAEQQCDQHGVSELASGRIQSHQNEGTEYPDKAEIAGRSYGYHHMIHERGIQVIMEPFEVAQLEQAEAADLLVSLILDLSLKLFPLLNVLLGRLDDYPFHRTDSNTGGLEQA